MDWFQDLNPVVQSFIATIFTWGITALGALVVCFFKEINKKVLDTILGFSAGVMIAAAFWSLIAPAIDLAEELRIQSMDISINRFYSRGIICIIIRYIFR